MPVVPKGKVVKRNKWKKGMVHLVLLTLLARVAYPLVKTQGERSCVLHLVDICRSSSEYMTSHGYPLNV